MLKALISVLTPSGDPEVGGTGTTGQLAKWSSSSSVTSSIVTDTGTAVGIGTTTPNFPLEVASDSTIANICARRAGSGGTFRGLSSNGTLAAPTATTSGNDLCLLSGRGHNGTNFVADACTLVRSFAEENFTPLANGSGISFETTPIGSTSASRAERMRIDASGNVGIGTTAPAGPLEIAASGTSNLYLTRATAPAAIAFRASNGTLVAPTATASGNQLSVLGASGYNGTSFTSTPSTAIRSIADENFTPTANGASITFETTAVGASTAARAERMRVTSGGNVGIGTTSPTSRIYAVNDRPGAFVDIAVQNTSAVAGSAASFTGWASGVANVFSLYQENVDSSTCLVNYSATGPIRFFANSQLRMSITADGNVWTRSGLTNMTSGFFYVPAAAGAPTGVPTSIFGVVPMYYDTTNNKFYVYNGAWKGVALT